MRNRLLSPSSLLPPMSRRPSLVAGLALGVALAAGCSSTPAITEVGSGASGATVAGGAPASSVPKSSTTEDSLLTKLFASDFNPVCQGASVSKATPYVAAEPSHKVIYLAPYGDDDLIEQVTELPDDWKVTFDADADAYAAIDLVACADRTAETFVQDCDGYTKDDAPTQNIVKLHSATYKITLREATTGKEVATTELASEEATCPMFQMFDGTSDTVNSYAPVPEADLIAFLKPHVQP